jgi:hypothetical protein
MSHATSLVFTSPAYTELTSFTEASKFPRWRFTMNAEYDALL